MTPAQKRALEWLSADGSWRTKPGAMSAAIYSLHSSYWSGGLVGIQDGPFGPRGGHVRRFRLTAKGMAVRQRLLGQSDAPSTEMGQ